MDNKYFNVVPFPSVVSDFYTFTSSYSSFNSYKLLCYSHGGIRFNDSSVFYLYFTEDGLYPSGVLGSANGVRASFTLDSSNSLVFSGYVSPGQVFAHGDFTSCVSPVTNPLYYGVERSQDVTSFHVLLIPATILASLFFVFVYKMFKRVLF